ncbi:hypothetical protein FPQ18DRAFT_19026 [Pyronema domesticum]|nr:hypothetical protein FPQ18DRAFT_19026 [Pyronema domesticum]
MTCVVGSPTLPHPVEIARKPRRTQNSKEFETQLSISPSKSSIYPFNSTSSKADNRTNTVYRYIATSLHRYITCLVLDTTAQLPAPPRHNTTQASQTLQIPTKTMTNTPTPTPPPATDASMPPPPRPSPPIVFAPKPLRIPMAYLPLVARTPSPAPVMARRGSIQEEGAMR